MRTIKYRAWDKEERCYDTSCWVLQTGDIEFDVNRKDVVIQQWTGLKDINNRDIYEGDIVQILEGGLIRVVEFGQYFVGFERKDTHYGWYIPNSNVWSVCDEISLNERYTIEEYGVKILGNIFENPELLNGKD